MIDIREVAGYRRWFRQQAEQSSASCCRHQRVLRQYTVNICSVRSAGTKPLLHLYADYHRLLRYCSNIITPVMKEIGKQHCRLVPKSHRPTRRNKTVEFRRVGVSCVNWNLGGCKKVLSVLTSTTTTKLPASLDGVLLVKCNLFTITPHSPPLTVLETSASCLMNTSLFLTRSHLSPNLAITIFVSFAVSIHTSIP